MNSVSSRVCHNAHEAAFQVRSAARLCNHIYDGFMTDTEFKELGAGARAAVGNKARVLDCRDALTKINRLPGGQMMHFVAAEEEDGYYGYFGPSQPSIC